MLLFVVAIDSVILEGIAFVSVTCSHFEATIAGPAEMKMKMENNVLCYPCRIIRFLHAHCMSTYCIKKWQSFRRKNVLRHNLCTQTINRNISN